MKITYCDRCFKKADYWEKADDGFFGSEEMGWRDVMLCGSCRKEFGEMKKRHEDNLTKWLFSGREKHKAQEP